MKILNVFFVFNKICVLIKTKQGNLDNILLQMNECYHMSQQEIKEIMQVMHSILDEIKNKFIWYGHMRGMPETRFPK